MPLEFTEEEDNILTELWKEHGETKGSFLTEFFYSRCIKLISSIMRSTISLI